MACSEIEIYPHITGVNMLGFFFCFNLKQFYTFVTTWQFYLLMLISVVS